MCMHTYICIAMSTHLVGEAYTLLHRNSYEMTPRWGVIPVRNDTPLGGCNDTPSGGCKKKFPRFARIFLLHPPGIFLHLPRLQIPGNNPAILYYFTLTQM